VSAGPWDAWDFEVQRGHWWQLRVLAMTETHAQGATLVRVRLTSRATRFNTAVSIILLCALVPGAFWTGGWMGLWMFFGSFVAWLALEFHHGGLGQQVIGLLTKTAKDLGFTVISGAPEELPDPQAPRCPGNDAARSEWRAPEPSAGSCPASIGAARC
jgi:hypothetical protein